MVRTIKQEHLLNVTISTKTKLLFDRARLQMICDVFNGNGTDLMMRPLGLPQF